MSDFKEMLKKIWKGTLAVVFTYINICKASWPYANPYGFMSPRERAVYGLEPYTVL